MAIQERSAVVALVEYEGRILVGRKIVCDHWLSDQWHMPGGHVKEGETDEGALRREMKEETNIEIRIFELLAEYQSPKGTKVRWYRCEPLTHELQAGDDLAEIRYMTRREALNICNPQLVALWPKEIIDYLRQ